MKLNLGCGHYPLPSADWTNVDADPMTPADVHADCLAYLAEQPARSVDAVWACHFLEHLPRPQAKALLSDCHRVLKPGGKLGLVVPDMRAVLEKYVKHSRDTVPYPDMTTLWHMDDLDDVCGLFLYGSAQASQHHWAWESYTLKRAMLAAGFVNLVEVDRYKDKRLGSPAWYQVGYEGMRNGE